MINYFAGGARYVSTNGKMYGLGYKLINNHLISWVDQSELKLREDYFNKKSNVLIDSGAFTAFTKGKKIDIYEYSKFIKSYTLTWKKKTQSINFINLDVIGDAEKSWENQHKLEKLNVNTIPVIHHEGFKKKHLEKAYKEYDYFAVGGLVGKKRTQILMFLDYCFRHIFTYVKKGNKLPKIHLLGVASDKILYRYPAFSCDSTAFMKVNKFGSSDYLKIQGLPRTGKKSYLKYKNKKKDDYNQENDQQLLNKIMKKEIQAIQKQEIEITKFWKKKGIIFNEQISN